MGRQLPTLFLVILLRARSGSHGILGSLTDRTGHMRGVAKANLPARICAVCGRLFVWRKKWERDWQHVKYCSDACRRKGARSER
jgi:hypothetical protein